MPPQDQVASKDTVKAFQALPDERKRAALGKMSEPAKQALLAGIRATKTPKTQETQPQSFLQRLKSAAWTKPGDIAAERPPVMDSGENPALGTAPGTKIPIREAAGEAGALSSFAAGSGTRMGMPGARFGSLLPENWKYVAPNEVSAAHPLASFGKFVKRGSSGDPTPPADTIDYARNQAINRARITNTPSGGEPSGPATGSAPRGSAMRGRVSPPPKLSESGPTETSGARPTESEQFATWLSKQSVWTPEMEQTAMRLWGSKARMRPGEGMVNYRARIQGYGYAARSSTGMRDLENNPVTLR